MTYDPKAGKQLEKMLDGQALGSSKPSFVVPTSSQQAFVKFEDFEERKTAPGNNKNIQPSMPMESQMTYN